MPVVTNLIQTEQDGTISFGDYSLGQKTKKSDYSFQGDSYKVKTYNEITRLERNGALVYESVPGTSVFHFHETTGKVSFEVDGEADAQITLELEENSDYEVLIDGVIAGTMKTMLGGKLTVNVPLSNGKGIKVEVIKK